MLKNVEKRKILVCLGIVILSIILFGNTNSFATDSSSGSLTITPTTDNTSVATNTTNTNINTTTNNTTNSPTTNTSTNTSTYNTTSNTGARNSNLPYTGSNDSKTILLVVAFAVSAVYAYKKVSDYNM